MGNNSKFDVIVIGAGNAGLSAALAAHEAGASVLVVESAPEHMRGGNSYFTGGLFRFAYQNTNQIFDLVPNISREQRSLIDIGTYNESKYYADVMRVTNGLANPELVQTLVSNSYITMKWLQEKGVDWILSYGRQAFKKDGIFKFWGGLIVEAVGGGKGLSDKQFDSAKRAGIKILYQTKGIQLTIDLKGKIVGVKAKRADGFTEFASPSIVLACGGFESNAEMRTRYLGPGWELAKVRGTRFNTGDGIRMALDIGAQPYGHWSGCHAVAWDLNAPQYGDRTIADLFQKHSYPFGLIVNVEGKRFVDEGADFRNYTYAKYGRTILDQPQRTAFQIFDQKTEPLLRDEYRIPQTTLIKADTIQELADGLDIDKDGLETTLKEFNAAVQPGVFDPSILDGKHTEGVNPPKSNWALTIDTPPYLGYAVTCGITFTFGGLKINNQSQVLDTYDMPIPGLYAAGELVGGLFYENYPGGAGLMAGSVFGKIAGRSATQNST